MLINDLQKANIEAMKAKDQDARSILSVVLTKYKLQEVEARAAGKSIGDAELLSIIQKVLKELSDEKEGYAKVLNQERVDSITRQENVIKGYLPQQLSEDEIRAEIAKLDDKSLPNIMKHFKMNFAGKVDMSKVSQIARSL
ncbi:MAG: GatB/YqeY domain-containing protein [Bacilli bacterium]|nr:GatB/YqeY domain-containing protein [Bacilli bacterium]MBO4682339.1 GatB/YqeY domain-containing protein [Bacilli bacterium]